LLLLPPYPRQVLWDDLEMVEHGCLFWPDFWARSERKDLLYDMVGLEYKPALVRSQGCGSAGVKGVVCWGWHTL
jgi:hypothetical protein